MHASRLTITKETREKLKAKLPRAEKLSLRLHALKDYVATYENGHGFAMKELAIAAGYPNTEKGQNSGYAFLKYQEKKGNIKLEDLGPSQGFSVTIAETLILKNPKKKKQEKIEGETKAEEITDVVFIQQVKLKAKDFAWEKNSDSLREFIGSLF